MNVGYFSDESLASLFRGSERIGTADKLRHKNLKLAAGAIAANAGSDNLECWIMALLVPRVFTIFFASASSRFRSAFVIAIVILSFRSNLDPLSLSFPARFWGNGHKKRTLLAHTYSAATTAPKKVFC